MKKTIWVTIIAVIIVGGGFYGWRQLFPAQIVRSLRIGYNIDSVNHAPIMVANDAHLFEKEQLKVKLVPMKSGKEVQQALATGQIDLGSSGATNFYNSIAKGAPVKIIASSTISPTQVFVQPNSNIRSFSDLVGKAVATRKGGSSDLAFGLALQREHVRLDQLTYYDMDDDYAPLALVDKKIVDIAVAGQGSERHYLDAGAVPFSAWMSAGYNTLSLPRTVIAVNTDFLRDHRATVDSFVRAYIATHRYIKNHPQESAGLIAQHITTGTAGAITMSAADVLASWKVVKYSLWIDPAEYANLASIAKSLGNITSTMTAEQIMSLQYEQTLRHAQAEIY